MSMEYHDESPPPGAPGAVPQFANPDQVLSPPMPWPAPPSPIVPVPIPPRPHFPIPQFETAFASKSRVALLPGQSAGKKDPALQVTFRRLIRLRFRVCR